MPAGWFCGLPNWFAVPEQPQPCRGKRRGVTQSPKRAKRRNRKKQ
jgi:hypothetical protein